MRTLNIIGNFLSLTVIPCWAGYCIGADNGHPVLNWALVVLAVILGIRSAIKLER